MKKQLENIEKESRENDLFHSSEIMRLEKMCDIFDVFMSRIVKEQQTTYSIPDSLVKLTALNHKVLISTRSQLPGPFEYD